MKSNPYATPNSLESESARIESTGVPRLGLRHLLIWFAVFGALFLFHVGIYGVAQQRGGEQYISLGIGIFSLVRLAALITGLLVLTFSYRNRGSLFQSPGHWFLLITLIGEILNISTTIAYAITGSLDWSASASSVYLFVSVAVISCAAIWTQPVWRYVFVALAIRPGVLYVFRRLANSVFMSWAGRIVGVVDLAVIVVAVSEAVQRVKRDWIHWLGVIIYSYDLAMTLFYWMMNQRGVSFF